MKCPTCGKVAHPTREKALGHIATLYRAGRGNPDYRPYRCGDYWHIGHSAISFRKRIQKALAPGRSKNSIYRRRAKK